MAAFMPSDFTAPDRRKKVITYGKASRLAPRPLPATSSDAPSPERPRKHPAVTDGVPKTADGSRHARSGGRDIFDVPSDDDDFATPAIKPTRKVQSQNLTLGEKRKAPIAGNRPTHSRPQPSNARQAERGATATSLATDAPTKARKPTNPPEATAITQSTAEPLISRSTRRGQTPQPTPSNEQRNEGRPGTQRQTHKLEKNVSSAQASKKVLPPSKATISAPTTTSQPSRALPAVLPKKPLQTADIFDLHSSDDESHMPTPKPVRRAPIVAGKDPAKTVGTHRAPPETESEDSEVLKKRKRKGSVSSQAPKPAVEQNEDDSLPLRSRKAPKTKEGDSPGHDHVQSSSLPAQSDPQLQMPVVDKPKRTRQRTVPVLAQPSIAKGQSSPATLRSMIPRDRPSQPSPVIEAPEVTTLEDETMYEIPDVASTPLRRQPDPSSGSVTPRQKALFGSLLGTSSSSATPMLSMSKLQLTDRKTPSLLGALARSKSDLSHGAQARKGKLIASLKQPESSSDDAASGSENDSSDVEEMESEKVSAAIEKRVVDSVSQLSRAVSVEVSDDMEIEHEAAADSQTSQATSTFGARSKFTYAKSRSYLQEANPEDAFLMSMDLDQPITFGSQNKDNDEDEEEEASQVQANHELKRQGHNTKFHWDNQMLIDDIAPRSNNSIRRSAMLELCTKMADETFTHDLLDSSLADNFFENASSSGEVIFDFAVAVASLYLLHGKSDLAVLDQVHQSEIPSSLSKLLDQDADILKIAKNRKSNLSRIAQDSVATFRTAIIDSTIWPAASMQKVSPRIVALKGLQALVVGLRRAGNMEPMLTQQTTAKLIDIAAALAEGPRHSEANEELTLVLNTVFSTLEAVSLAKQRPVVWSAQMLQRLAKAMTVAFPTGDAATITLAVKLCMNLSNNKPKACQHFSDQGFVQALVRSIVDRAKLLQGSTEETQRAQTLDTVILSLGAMINLTEHSNQARTSVDDGGQLIENLVAAFVAGSARTAQAASMKQSQSSVVVGYLSVLLGNMCLDAGTKSMICAHLPNQSLGMLVEKIKEFLHVHEQANRHAKEFRSEEGQETWQNYTARIMQVVENLEESGI